MSSVGESLHRRERLTQRAAPRAVPYELCLEENADSHSRTASSAPQAHIREDALSAADPGDSRPVEQARYYDAIVYHADPSSPGADSFRLLRTRLSTLRGATNLKTILITSPLPGEGKTTIALNLATALTEQGTRSVLIVDADLHSGSVEERLGLAPGAGVIECLQGTVSPCSAVRLIKPFGWHLLSSGRPNSVHPADLLRPGVFAAMLQQLLPNFDWILVDSPPVLPVPDSLGLAQEVDGTLMVAMAERTPRSAVEEAIELIGATRLLGFVLNRVEGGRRVYSQYASYHRSARSC